VARPASILDRPRTDERILDAALGLFATRGYDATSLDAIAAELGVRKQTILYWFASKEALLDAVVERSAAELAQALDAAIAGAGPGRERIDAVLQEVFRFGVRRPALLGLLRELNRLGPPVSAGLEAGLHPLIERATALLADEMAAGRVRQSDPKIVLVVLYATVVGVATETEAQRMVGLAPGVTTLRRLRRELLAFVRAALAP
jgi:TetR/AcrR family transcriptional regulator